MKNINLLLLTLFFLVSCSGFKEAGKVLRNEKVNSTDEFLVKKREPLILPPDYDKMPEPNSNSNTSKSKETNRIKNKLLRIPKPEYCKYDQISAKVDAVTRDKTNKSALIIRLHE